MNSRLHGPSWAGVAWWRLFHNETSVLIPVLHRCRHATRDAPVRLRATRTAFDCMLDSRHVLTLRSAIMAIFATSRSRPTIRAFPSADGLLLLCLLLLAVILCLWDWDMGLSILLILRSNLFTESYCDSGNDNRPIQGTVKAELGRVMRQMRGGSGVSRLSFCVHSASTIGLGSTSSTTGGWIFAREMTSGQRRRRVGRRGHRLRRRRRRGGGECFCRGCCLSCCASGGKDVA